MNRAMIQYISGKIHKVKPNAFEVYGLDNME